MATENDSSNPKAPSADMVLAYGENGLEPTPADEVVWIEEIPLGEDNIVVPATVRWLSTIRSGGGIPTRLRKIQRPNSRRPHVLVEYDCTPFERIQNSDGTPVMGDWSSCYVRHLQDARDAIFNGLTDNERSQIAHAVATGAETRGAA